MLKFDIPNYLTKGGISFGLMLLYNTVIDNNSVTSKYALTDSLTFSLSNISTIAIKDILSNFYNSYEGLSSMVINPLLNGFLYMYLYEYFLKNQLEYWRLNLRSNNTNFMIGAGGNILISWISNPLLSLFGLKSY